ncbi:quinone oxidoreductase family protein [Priestia taiwanensis]|uniref:Quinone oxidoreductase n=1 Tax=Priestia taiwanensis TaxID=1347902 RepID=A0A917AP63_9BACI|nr:zinc-binding dehydrogenase [Priestia taiwanensis]MBM7362581.1 NADPH2:quinone reductase [Priestia taiwanensis]GGE63385.1 quinone oxidoreductase [Priestia taiwanensis]
MKAIVITELGGPEVMKYMEVAMPSVKENEVLIRVEKTSVNFADVKSRYGKKGAAKLPFIPGIDAAGVVVEVGANVTSFQVGQRVLAFPSNGSYAEYIVANEKLTFALPDELDFTTAAACPIVSFLSYSLLANVAKIEKGETVLIHAASGGVGTTAIQLAKLLGANTVIGAVGSEQKRGIALEAGADHVISYEKEGFAEEIMTLTDNKGVDIILDSVSGTIAEKSFTSLAPYGRFVQFGNSGGHAAIFKSSGLHASCRSVLGFSLGTTRKLRPHLLQETAKHVFSYLVNGDLHIKVGQHFPLEEATKAHEWMESRQSTGKIILDVR